jgi:beta-lactamase regulating signal transducer with metallopeptidase domain
MSHFWAIVASNALIVTAMAAGVALLGRIWKNPPGLHLLWALVLVKLFLPPIFTIPVALPAGKLATTPSTPDRHLSDPRGSTQESVSDIAVSTIRQSALPQNDIKREAAGRLEDGIPSVAWLHERSWLRMLAWMWGIGTVGLALVRGCAIARFQRLLRFARPASPAVSDMAVTMGRQLGLRRIPEILTLPVRLSPLVWTIGARPRVVLPTGLCQRLDSAALRTILVHELAHIRRNDHVVRLLELAATTLFWWHPVTWWAAGQLRELEEECCDSVVLGTVPFGMQTYATAILDTLDFLLEGPVNAPLAATTVRPSVSLARRIRMLQDNAPARRLRLGHLLLLAAPLAFPMAIAVAAQAPSGSEEVSTDRQSGPPQSTVALAPPGKPGDQTIAAEAEKITFKDPKGDDDGPGSYTYPTDPAYTPGSFDLTEFSITRQGDRVKFEVAVAAPLADPWKMRTGFSVQMVFIFIQTDNRRGQGFTETVPGLNFTFAPADAWDKLVILSPQPAARVEEEIEAKVPEAERASIIVPDRAKGADHTIWATVDLAQLGGGDPSKWSYQVVMQSNEAFPDGADLLTRKVNVAEAEHRFGGGTNSDCDPHVMDILAGKAAGEAGEVRAQHDMLVYECNPDGSTKQGAVLKMVRK